ncbi:predicted protein [Postia placenta Mad-698-R]|nr:predicted protein [Postia placenta Mad-698-R]
MADTQFSDPASGQTQRPGHCSHTEDVFENDFFVVVGLVWLRMEESATAVNAEASAIRFTSSNVANTISHKSCDSVTIGKREMAADVGPTGNHAFLKVEAYLVKFCVHLAPRGRKAEHKQDDFLSWSYVKQSQRNTRCAGLRSTLNSFEHTPLYSAHDSRCEKEKEINWGIITAAMTKHRARNDTTNGG